MGAKRDEKPEKRDDCFKNCSAGGTWSSQKAIIAEHQILSYQKTSVQESSLIPQQGFNDMWCEQKRFYTISFLKHSRENTKAGKRESFNGREMIKLFQLSKISEIIPHSELSGGVTWIHIKDNKCKTEYPESNFPFKKLCMEYVLNEEELLFKI